MSDARLQFGEFTFTPATGELVRNGTAVPLEHQPARALAHLAAAGGRLVTREELAAAIWPNGTHVKFDDGLNYCVRQLRIALGDDAKAPEFIETIPRRGYRFIASATTPRPNRSSARWLAISAAAAALAFVAVAESRPNNHHDIAVAVARAIHDVLF